MYAEVSLHFAQAVHRDFLLTGMPLSANHLAAIERTVFRATPDFASSIIYSQVMPTEVFLVFQPGADSLRIHVECMVDAGSMSRLKHAAENVARMFADAGTRARCACGRIDILIYAENNLIQRGCRLGLVDTLRRRFFETIGWDVIVATVTLASGLTFGADLISSGMIGVATMTALVAWMGWEAWGNARGYAYVDA